MRMPHRRSTPVRIRGWLLRGFSSVKEMIAQVVAGRHLSRVQARGLFGLVMSGRFDGPSLGAVLCALATKGEHVDEIIGAAEAIRAAAVRVRSDRHCLCTCGTGGDGISTFNVSTTAAILAAACGAVVAKHGNRTNSRVSGSAEVLAALGVNVEAGPAVVERCLAELNIAFLYAPSFHPAMRHAAAVRRAIRSRTIFNLLGPLCNPADVKHQVVGVSRREHVTLIAHALIELGAERAWVVHGDGKLCDLAITGPSEVCEVADGRLKHFTVEPKDAGLSVAPLESLLVCSAQESADAVRAILAGERGPRRDHALLNAAAALVVYGLTDDLKSAVALAADGIDTGAAQAKLESLVSYTNARRSGGTKPY